MVRIPIQLGVSRPNLKHQHAAEIQTCVPAVAIKGESYRMRGHREKLTQLRAAVAAGGENQ